MRRSRSTLAEAKLGRRSSVAQPGPDEAFLPEFIQHNGKRIGELLIEKGIVNESQISEALLQQTASGKRIGNLLLELSLVTEQNIAEALSKQTGLERVDLGEVEPSEQAVALVPETLARQHNVIPLSISEGQIEVAISDPYDSAALLQIAQAANLQVVPLIASRIDIRRTIDATYRALSGIANEIEAFKAIEEARGVVAQGADRDLGSDSAPVVRVVNLMVTQGLRDRASDIHIEPQEGRLRIRYRIDGALHDVLALPEMMGPAVVSRIKIMAGMNIVEKMRPQDGQIEMDVEGRALDIRVATTPTIWGEKAVLRLLDKSRPLYRLDDLGMTPDVHKVYSKLVRSPFGMVINAGPTGSGKTTTLYATLSEINDTEKNIMTIEDPVEYVFPSINQIAIREKAGVSFAGGLKAILRQDPDIILIGEIRDIETARIAVQSALTGHFVLSSLHATDAPSALHRFMDMGIESFLIVSSLLAVVGQRLVRRICTHCKTTYTPTSEEMSFYQLAGGKGRKKFWKGEGCNFCAQTGYQDRIGIFELLRVTEEMKELIFENAPLAQIRALAVIQGMKPLREQGVALVNEGTTTISELLKTLYVAGMEMEVPKNGHSKQEVVVPRSVADARRKTELSELDVQVLED